MEDQQVHGRCAIYRLEDVFLCLKVHGWCTIYLSEDVLLCLKQADWGFAALAVFKPRGALPLWQFL